MNRRELSSMLWITAGASLSAPAAQATSEPRSQSTTAERAAGVTPANPDYAPGHFRRYGAAGDGKTDDTAALNRAIAVLNAGQGSLTGEPRDVYLCSPLDVVKADAAIMDGHGMTLKVKADSWQNTADGSTHLNFTGAGIRVLHLKLDGNQGAFTRGARGRLLQFANDAMLLDVTVRNSPAQGARSGGNHGLLVGCHFDDNANLGLELDAAANMKFVCCTWNRNGYGFRQTLATNAFAAFGLSIRFRSHHLSFEGCDALQNGRDGFGLGQGSYACRFSGCTAWMNGDGGFTIHSDKTAPGAPGDGEYCYDLEYVDCESYNNYGSGLVAFTPAYNVTVSGGRYYNNHRVAGSLSFQSSYPNGIYFAAGSRGIVVATKAYDDRQLCVLAAVSGNGSSRTLTAKGWVAGTAETYPKVAFYSDGGQFQGYGVIVSESTGSITVGTLPHDNVAFEKIAPGWRVSQRVQHNGCFLDNDCQGRLDIDGFGLLPGPRQYTGWKSLSGFFTNGQNVRLPSVHTDPTLQLNLNGSFDENLAGWIFSTVSGGSATLHTGPKRRSTGSLELRGGADQPATGDAALDKDALRAVADSFVEVTAWCYADRGGDGGLQLFWNPNPSSVVLHTTVEHPGGGWKCLVIGAFVPASATQLFPRLYATASKTCYFDSVSMCLKVEPCDEREIAYPGRNLPL